MILIEQFSLENNIPVTSINKTIELFEEGATIPFISRYRKEVTGDLNEIQIREIFYLHDKIKKLEERKEEIFNSLQNQGVTDKEIFRKIEQATSLKELELLYEPFKKKQQNKALIAREKGLDIALSHLLSGYYKDINNLAKHISQEKDLPDLDSVCDGIKDLLDEKLKLDLEYREWFKQLVFKFSYLRTKKKQKADDPKNLYQAYYDKEWNLKNLPDWRVLAINRAEKEKIINVKISPDTDKLLEIVFKQNFDNFWLACASKAVYQQKIHFLSHKSPSVYDFILNAYKDSIKSSLFPSIEREIRSDLTETAHKRAIEVFQKNLRALLLTQPLEKKSILAIDPGYRTGCKCALIDANGQFITHKTVFITIPQKDIEKTEKYLNDLHSKYSFELVAIGNGTGSKETEDFISNWIIDNNLNIEYIIVSEAGASVYSASESAIQEFPELDVTVRGAISIGRRVQDMLDELIKIPPESIGVGMYQHDIPEKDLKEKLKIEVESVVNSIGVDFNRASVFLLQYVSGLSFKLASAIVEYRKKHGLFHSRNDLFKIKGIGEKTYIQCVGFCKIYESENIFDQTFLHPESYHIAEIFLNSLNISTKDLKEVIKELSDKQIDFNLLSQKINVSENQLKDICKFIIESKHDFRKDFPQPLKKQKSLTFEELSIGQSLFGVIRNVTDFGAFVDIGLKNDALLYASKCKNEELSVMFPGQIIEVVIENIEMNNERVGLRLK